VRITTFASPRDALPALAGRLRGETLARLSRLIGRPDHYLGRFVREGSPRELLRRERQLLARFLGADVRDLGGDELDQAELAAFARAAGPRRATPRQRAWWEAGGRPL
jgi:hypothetical protein